MYLVVSHEPLLSKHTGAHHPTQTCILLKCISVISSIFINKFAQKCQHSTLMDGSVPLITVTSLVSFRRIQVWSSYVSKNFKFYLNQSYLCSGLQEMAINEIFVKFCILNIVNNHSLRPLRNGYKFWVQTQKRRRG